MNIRKRSNTLYDVQSDSDGTKWYGVFHDGHTTKCPCKGFLTHKHCRHADGLTDYLYGNGEIIEQLGEAVEPEEEPTTDLKQWTTIVHGKEVIVYKGLLALAHGKGLLELGAKFISVTDTLALAESWATFKDGSRFREAADATPTNVGPMVKAHFARMALTRAKARVLRDALNIGMVSIEELEE